MRPILTIIYVEKSQRLQLTTSLYKLQNCQQIDGELSYVIVEIRSQEIDSCCPLSPQPRAFGCGLWGHTTCFWISPLPIPSSVPLGKALHLSKPVFLICKMVRVTELCHRAFIRINLDAACKPEAFGKCLCNSRCCPCYPVVDNYKNGTKKNVRQKVNRLSHLKNIYRNWSVYQ